MCYHHRTYHVLLTQMRVLSCLEGRIPIWFRHCLWSPLSCAMSPTAESISLLLGPLYEAAASSEHWPEFFEALRRQIQTNKVFFLLMGQEDCSEIKMSLGVDPVWQRAYEENYYRHDVLLHNC